MKLDWLEDYSDEEFKEFLDKDAELIVERCGRRVFMALLREVCSIQLYISKTPIIRAQRRYIMEHFDGENHRELAAEIGCSERFVYETLERHRRAQRSDTDETEQDLFTAKTGTS